MDIVEAWKDNLEWSIHLHRLEKSVSGCSYIVIMGEREAQRPNKGIRASQSPGSSPTGNQNENEKGEPKCANSTCFPGA